MQWELVESCTICLKTNKQKLYRTKFDKIAFNDDITETKVIAGSTLHHCPSFDKNVYPLLLSSHTIFDVLWRLVFCLLNKKTVVGLGHTIKYWWRALRLGYSIFSYISKTTHIASIDIDLPHWQDGHCRAFYYLMLTIFQLLTDANLLIGKWCPGIGDHLRPSVVTRSQQCHKLFVTSHRKRNVSRWKVKSFQLDSNPTPALGNLLAHILQ